MKKHSHPSHRNVPDKNIQDNPNMSEEAKQRSDKWLQELSSDDRDMLAKQTYINNVFVGTD